jgi:hypothetical protein
MTMIRVTLCMLVAALVAGTAGAAVRGPRHTAACAPSEGKVVGFINTAQHQCGATHVNTPLGRNEIVQTKASPASLTFSTNHLYRCIESSNSKDKLVGVGGVAVVHLAGTIRCKHNSGDLYKTVTTPNATISTSGTIYGITTTPKGTTVKSFDGLLRVVSTATKQGVQVPSEFQTFVPRGGSPQEPQALVQTADDHEAFTLLDLDTIMLGIPQTGEYLQRNKQKSAVVVAVDSQTAAPVIKALRAKTTFVPADQAQSDPQSVATAVKELGAKTVVMTGTFDDLENALATVRDAVPPEIALLFAPQGG